MKDDDTMVAYHGDPAVKAALLERIAHHERHEAIAQRTYGSPRHGEPGEVVWERCAVGCSVHDLATTPQKDLEGGDLHHLYPDLLGVPVWLAYVEDYIFEALAWPDPAEGWPRRFADAIPVGGSFDGLADRLAADRLRDLLPHTGLWRAADRDAVVEGIAALEDGDPARRARAVEAARLRGDEVSLSARQDGVHAAMLTVVEAVATARPLGSAWWGEAMEAASGAPRRMVWLMEADRLIAALRDLPVAP